MADVQFNNNADVIFNDTLDNVIWIHNVPVLTTQFATDLADASFTGNGTITEHGGENASRRGFCFIYDVTGDPTIADNVVYADGDFNPEAYFLSVSIDIGKHVRYRAYAVNNMGIGYGDTVQVLTLVIAAPFVSVSGLSGPPLASLAVDPLATEGALESSLLFQAPTSAFVSTSGLDASLLCQLVPDALASVSVLEATIYYQIIVIPGPFVTSGLLSATEALAFRNTEDYTLTYECTFNDLPLPIKSFSARFSTAQKSQVTVVIPNIDYADIIADTVIDNYDAGETILGRLSVFIVKTYPSGNVVRERLTNVILEDVGYTEDVTIGAIKEITLSGTLDETWSAKTITLSGASYRSIIGGSKSYRCSPDLYLRPGDTVLINGDIFTVNSVTWFIDPDQEMMTISEKAA